MLLFIYHNDKEIPYSDRTARDQVPPLLITSLAMSPTPSCLIYCPKITVLNEYVFGAVVSGVLFAMAYRLAAGNLGIALGYGD